MIISQKLDGREIVRIWLKRDVINLLLFISSHSIDLALLLGNRACSAALTPKAATPKHLGQAVPKTGATILIGIFVTAPFF